MTALAQRIFGRQTYKLTAADLLSIAKQPWENAFNLARCQKAWAMIGVCPFTQSVYWDLLEAEGKSAKKAKEANINPSLLSVRGMVGVMFGLPTNPDGSVVASAGDKRARDTMHSRDLWDLPGGATADDCFNIVRTKTEAREAKASSVKNKKALTEKKVADSRAAGLSLGSKVVGMLTDSSQVPKLKVDELRAVLQFRAVVVPKGAKKPGLVSLVEKSLGLPTAEISPPMLMLHMPASASGSALGVQDVVVDAVGDGTEAEGAREAEAEGGGEDDDGSEQDDESDFNYA
jgi:hypothetical protein